MNVFSFKIRNYDPFVFTAHYYLHQFNLESNFCNVILCIISDNRKTPKCLQDHLNCDHQETICKKKKQVCQFQPLHTASHFQSQNRQQMAYMSVSKFMPGKKELSLNSRVFSSFLNMWQQELNVFSYTYLRYCKIVTP